MDSFSLPLSSFSETGQNLKRPECVLATGEGTLYTSDWRGGIGVTRPDGSQDLILAKDQAINLRPNGIALEKAGSFLIANLSDTGGVYRLFRDGSLEPVVEEIDNCKMPATNFVLLDARDRIWITVSTVSQPRELAYRKDTANGFIALKDDKGCRIVADNLCYTNEIRIDPGNEWLYVIESFARRLSRFKLSDNGISGKRETVAEFDSGTFPDGLAFDCEGGIWITNVVSNRLIRIDPNGKQQILVEDVDAQFLEEVESAFLTDSLALRHLGTIKSKKLKSISSIAFGGPDLKTIYLGCLLGNTIATTRSPVAGVPPVHWNFQF